MKIDKIKVRAAFQAYADQYDPADNKISLKIKHTYKVAETAEIIAADVFSDQEEIDLAWLLGMLHDIGRFEQVRRFGTFLDQESIDHAELGADILFHEGKIADYLMPEADADPEQCDALYALIEKAIRLHNKLTLPPDLNETERLYCQILRDADKIDIFRVLVEERYSEGKGADPLPDERGARDEIMECVRSHRCVPRLRGRNTFEIQVSHCCMAFELVYKKSRKLVIEQGNLAKILSRPPHCEKAKQQMDVLQRELNKVLFHDTLTGRLEKLAEANRYPFHMPGHKRAFPKAPAFLKEAARYDITEIDGFDDLHCPEEILLAEQKRAAALFGAKESFFLVGGSTAGILSAICSQTAFGDPVILARNCHKSAYHALCLSGLLPTYVCPRRGGVTLPEDVAAAMDASGAKLVCITSPTYEGITSDLSAIAEAVHERDGILVVDEAHGAHLSLMHGYESGTVKETSAQNTPVPDFPQSAVACGADLVIQSLHKTMPALTQTALLHRCSDRIDTEKLRLWLQMLQTSSPSYLLMGSVCACLDLMEQGALQTDRYASLLSRFYADTKKLRHLTVLSPDAAVRETNAGFDPGKLLIRTEHLTRDGKPFGGAALKDLLLERYQLDLEMAAPDYCLAMTSVCDTKEGFDRLTGALLEIDETLSFAEGENENKAALPASLLSFDSLTTEALQSRFVCSPRKALDAPAEKIPPAKAEGRIAACFVMRYPPGIPLLVPGERITAAVLEQIAKEQASGMHLYGIADGIAVINAV